jgi:hypothetical protein
MQLVEAMQPLKAWSLVTLYELAGSAYSMQLAVGLMVFMHVFTNTGGSTEAAL